MPDESNKILKYKYGEKSLKALFMIYVDLKCLLEKMHSCQNIFEKSYTEKKTKHAPSGYSFFPSFSLDTTKNLNVTEGKTVWKGFVKLKRACNENS